MIIKSTVDPCSKLIRVKSRLDPIYLIFVGVVGVWMKEGFSGVQTLLSPFNVANWIVTVLTLAPGIGALALVSKLQDKMKKTIPNKANAADR